MALKGRRVAGACKRDGSDVGERRVVVRELTGELVIARARRPVVWQRERPLARGTQVEASVELMPGAHAERHRAKILVTVEVDDCPERERQLRAGATSQTGWGSHTGWRNRARRGSDSRFKLVLVDCVRSKPARSAYGGS